jgi:hypothetical protein
MLAKVFRYNNNVSFTAISFNCTGNHGDILSNLKQMEELSSLGIRALNTTLIETNYP